MAHLSFSVPHLLSNSQTSSSPPTPSSSPPTPSSSPSSSPTSSTFSLLSSFTLPYSFPIILLWEVNLTVF
jgi:hypothetical protein